MRHTLGNITFEVEDELTDCSNYIHESSDGSAEITFGFDPVHAGSADAAAVLARAHEHFQGSMGPHLIYSKEATFTRGNGSSVPGVEGEYPEGLLGDRFRYALMALTPPHKKVTILYLATSRPDALRLFRQVLAHTFLLGEPTSESRPVPTDWARRQANCLLFATPRNWTAPQYLVFRTTGIDLEVLLTEPFVPEGTIDLLPYLKPDGHEVVTKLKTRPVVAAGVSGWTGDWSIAGGARAPGDETRVRKLSVRFTNGTTFSAYARCENISLSRLDHVWDTLTQTMRPAIETDG